MGRGRTEKLNYKQVKQLMNEFGKRDLRFKEIADIFCVTPQTVTRYMQRHPEIRKAYNEGRGNLIKDLKNSAFTKAVSGDSTMLKYALNNLTTYSDQPLVDNSQHTHVTYIWKNEDDRDSVLPAEVPERNSLQPEEI